MQLDSFSPRFLLSSDKDKLAAALTAKKSATVEAEYGDDVVEGSLVTMAHHGSRAGQPAPCSYKNYCEGDLSTDELRSVEVVGLSHVDLDSAAGCAAIIGKKPEDLEFWNAAEHEDLNGRHKINSSNTSEKNIRRLDAFRAWIHANPINAARDGSVTDVTDQVLATIDIIIRILDNDNELLAAGDSYREGKDQLNRDSFVKVSDNGVIARVKRGDDFVNDLYSTPEGAPGRVVVSFSPKKGKIVLSFADLPQGKDAEQIMKELFGEGAGGHAGIAATPREGQYTEGDFNRVFDFVVKVLESTT